MCRWGGAVKRRQESNREQPAAKKWLSQNGKSQKNAKRGKDSIAGVHGKKRGKKRRFAKKVKSQCWDRGQKLENGVMRAGEIKKK